MDKLNLIYIGPAKSQSHKKDMIEQGKHCHIMLSLKEYPIPF